MTRPNSKLPSSMELALGGAGRGRRALAALDQGDLAEEAALRHRADEPAKALDMDGAAHDDVERLGRLALTQEHRAGRDRDEPGQHRHGFQAARLEFGEDREAGDDGALLVHGAGEHSRLGVTKPRG